MHERTTPKVFAQAKELRREMMPLVRKLWTHLCTHGEFIEKNSKVSHGTCARGTPVLAYGAREYVGSVAKPTQLDTPHFRPHHAIGNYVVEFSTGALCVLSIKIDHRTGW